MSSRLRNFVRVWRTWFLPGTVGAVVGVAILFGALTAINGRLPLPLPSPRPSPTPTPWPLPASAWTDVTPAPVSESTPPGTVLAFGNPAQLEIATGGGARALVRITASAPVTASTRDLGILAKADPQLDGMSVYYLPVTIEKLAGATLAGLEPGSLFQGVTGSGLALQSLTITDWKPCSQAPLPAAIDQPGNKVSVCLAAAAARGAPAATTTRFTQAGGPYDASSGTAVIWK